MKSRATKTRGTRTPTRRSKERLAEMIEEATVDAYDESEQATGWFRCSRSTSSFLSRRRCSAPPSPASTSGDGGQIVAICTRGRDRQAISLVDLPLPSPKPAGTDWIEAYRYWLGRR